MSQTIKTSFMQAVMARWIAPSIVSVDNEETFSSITVSDASSFIGAILVEKSKNEQSCPSTPAAARAKAAKAKTLSVLERKARAFI